MPRATSLKREKAGVEGVKRDLRTLFYLLGNGFEPTLPSLLELLQRYERLDDDAPPLPAIVVRYIAKKLKRPNGRPRAQFTLAEYEKLVLAESAMNARVAQLIKARKGTKKLLGALTPTQIALREVARQLGMKPATLQVKITRLNRISVM